MTAHPRLTITKIVFVAPVVVFCFFIFPRIVSADVRINEVAWMGTVTSANDEWIELYNAGTGKVDLDGWTVSSNGSLLIPLSGVIPAGKYFLLERTDDSTVPSASADVIYTGALGNGGATLIVKNKNGTVEDTVAGGGDWTAIGGDNATKDTAQRSVSGWITAAPTPRAGNAPTSAKKSEPTPQVALPVPVKTASPTPAPPSADARVEEKPRPMIAEAQKPLGEATVLLGARVAEAGNDVRGWNFYGALGGLVLVILLSLGALFSRKVPLEAELSSETFPS